ncbi:MAG: hypothetical protein GY696_12765 [Gammaproteobacteria bacterium]|nr:hypothetical protein [Gammaproteobacteria bacterium]
MAETREVFCWSCEVIHSEWRFRCGLFSHLKLAGVYSLAKLSPGSLNPLGVWTRFREWLREWGDVMALVCILIFFGTTAANVLTIIVVAVKAGPTVDAGVGRRLYDHHRHALRITLQEHQNSSVEKPGTEVIPRDKETGL